MSSGVKLSSFISPVTNRRTDEYGGPLSNRLRYPLSVFHAVRADLLRRLGRHADAADAYDAAIASAGNDAERAFLTGRRRTLPR